MSSSSEVTKNYRAWTQLFAKHRILNHFDQDGFFEITAAQINEFREARLMTKFDHRINLPKQFSENDLAILPISRGSYIISRFEAYQEFEQIDDKIIKVAFPEYIQSIDYENISSEAMAINIVTLSGHITKFSDWDYLVFAGKFGTYVDTFCQLELLHPKEEVHVVWGSEGLVVCVNDWDDMEVVLGQARLWVDEIRRVLS